MITQVQYDHHVIIARQSLDYGTASTSCNASRQSELWLQLACEDNSLVQANWPMCLGNRTMSITCHRLCVHSEHPTIVQPCSLGSRLINIFVCLVQGALYAFVH